MKLISIDVGIKNLAYCLLDATQAIAAPSQHKIIAWDVINLCGQPSFCTDCKKIAKFAHTSQSQASQSQSSQSKYFCTTHAKKSNFLLPIANLSLKKIKKMKIVDLQQVISEYKIPAIAPTTVASVKKEDLLKQVMTYVDEKMLTTVSAAKANDMDLIQIGIALRNSFDTELKDHLSTITHIVIENQISPIANRMKTLQGMIAQYFIMHEKTQISFVSAANKLKGHQDIETDTSTYALRKKEGIKVTLKILEERYPEWLTHFSHHKKKDDLADAFLQGNWYLNKN